MSRQDVHLPSGREPSLAREHAVSLSGMEPELGGGRRVKPDQRVVAMLLGHEDERQVAIAHILNKGWSRLYALELVKIVSSRHERRLRGGRWGFAYTTDQRIAATRALEAFGQAVAVEALVDALGDSAWWVGQYATDALIGIGQPAFDEVVEALNHRGPIVRRRAADILGHIGEHRATDALIAAADDDVAWVRMRVVQALARLADPRAIPTLRRALDDEDLSVWQAATRALSTLAGDDMLPSREYL